MRRVIQVAILGLALTVPAAALARDAGVRASAAGAARASATARAVTTATASAGGVTATLSYRDGPGITTKDERLTISQNGHIVYRQAVPARNCFKACSPDGKHPVHVVDLYGDGGEDVVLDLFSGGADCCTIEQVYVPSAAVNSYVLTQRNFGEAGAVLEDIGPKGRPEFVSGNGAFYCQFTFCAASGLPLQIFEFSAERFIDVTSQHPRLIAADASDWIKLYYKHPAEGQGVIAAWAADEENLGLGATVNTVLQLQTADGHLKAAFVRTLLSFLKKHGY
jgi:hypothetical protein